MNKFKELGLSDKLVRNLEKEGITEPTEIQEKAIHLTLKGQDVIGGSATGSGKTLAFAASIIENLKPAKEAKGIQALILTPTRELAEQISQSIIKFSKGFPVSILPIYGGVSIDNQIRKISTSNIVVGTPGRILDHINRKTLNLSHVKYLVLDEVDRMFEMGFQDDVERIIMECPKERQSCMFSATVSTELDYLSKKHSTNAKEIIVKSLVDPSMLKQIFYDVPSKFKFSLLVHLLNEENSDVVMVFCNTRRNVDFVADNLNLNGINAQAIHGGLNQSKRQNVLGKFHKGHVNVLVCTDVAARGLDIKGVTHVYNYDIPDNPTDYIHRIGRTARAGKEGIAINVVSDRDYDNFREVMDSDKLNIKQMDLPYVPRAKMKIPPKNDRGRKNFRGGRNNQRGSGRRDNRNNRSNKEIRDNRKENDGIDNRNNNRGRRDSRNGGGGMDRRNDKRDNRNNRDNNRGRRDSRSGRNNRDNKGNRNSRDRKNNFRGNRR